MSAGMNSATGRAAWRPAVITPVKGRLDHLRHQRRFLTETAPDVTHYVVAVDSPDLEAELAAPSDADVSATRRTAEGPLRVVHLTSDDAGMPTAAARNLGAETARRDGHNLLIFLDVDCVPLPGMVTRCVDAASQYADQAVLNVPVTYLTRTDDLRDIDADSAQSLINPHPARPAPGTHHSGSTHECNDVLNDDHHLLWSLAFAVTASQWERLGGFDTAYVGYGAEDTDFGMRARAAHLRMAWLAQAHALHQWHPSATPPTHHLIDIVRNATIFHRRWGFWPMSGWLTQFAADGLVRWSEDELALTSTGHERAAAARTALS